MIRKLLVQQQEADSTIAELSDALQRLEPSELERVDLQEMVKGSREEKRKQGKTFGVQHLNGAPHTGSNNHVSPWHIDSKKQDIAHAIHPGEYTTRTNDLVKSLAGRQTKSLVAPGSLFNLTSSPNNNPADILKYQDRRDKYKAPPVPKHLDSKVVKESLTKWGSDDQADAWERSSEKWHTHNEEVHGYSKFATTNKKITSRPSSAASRRHASTGVRRPASAMSRRASSICF